MAGKKKQSPVRSDNAEPSIDSSNPVERKEARLIAGKEAAKAPKEPKLDPDAQPASLEDLQNVRAGDAKADNKRPAPVFTGASSAIAPVPTRVKIETAEITESPLARVVDITAANQKIKGFRVEEVVATRVGHYSLKRRRPGEVFNIGLVGNGYLPSWVRLAKDPDLEPGVAISRQVGRTSSGQEIIDDVREDSGTEAPLYLGGNQRRPTYGNPRTVI